MAPILVTLIFGLALVLLAIRRPEPARIAFGIFYLLMALGVNLPLMLTHPEFYPAAGAESYLPIYRWFFQTILPLAPRPFILALILVEIAIGLLILSRGRLARVGLFSAALFCLLIAGLGIYEISCPVFSIAALILLRGSYDRSAIEIISSKKAVRTNVEK